MNADEGRQQNTISDNSLIQADFAILKCLLAVKDRFLTILHDTTTQKLTVFVDRAKIATHGKPAIVQLLLKLHIYKCTADLQRGKRFYEELTRPDGRFLVWRQIMLANKPPKKLFVQANTFVTDDGEVILKEYEPTVNGMIQSWAERMV